MAEAQALVARLRAEGELRLASFTSEELVAVGADSPLPGLVISDRLATLGPVPLTAALSAALRGLVARGFAHPELASAPGDVGLGLADRQLQQVLDSLSAAAPAGDAASLPLSGDLAAVVTLRRAPAVVCLVSEPTQEDLARRGPLAHRRTDAILHGFTSDDAELAGFLEERRSALGIHAFVLRTLERECQALCAGLLSRAAEPFGGGGRCEDVLEVAWPDDPERPSVRLLVAVEPGAGTARLSWPAGRGAPAGETLAADRLPERLGELLGGIWRDNGDGAALTAS